MREVATELQALRDAGRPRFAAAWLGALPIVGLVAFVTGIVLGTRGADIAILGLAIVTTLAALAPVILDQARPSQRRHLLLSLFALAWMMFFSIPLFTRYFFAEVDEYTALDSLLLMAPEDVIQGQLAALAALLLAYLAYALPFAGGLGRAVPKLSREWSEAAVLLVAAIMLPLGWTIYLAGQFGLIPKWAGSGVLGTLASSTYYGIGLLTLGYIRYRSRPAFLAIAVLVPLTMAFNFFTGSKALFLIPLGMVVLAYVVHNRRIRIRYVAAAIVGIALLYPVAQFYREVVLVGNTRTARDVVLNPGAAISAIVNYTSGFNFKDYLVSGLMATGTRSSAIDIATVIIRDTPERVPFQGGWSIGYIFLTYVPRFAWHGKPDITIGQWVTDHYTPAAGLRTHTGPSWIGELYMNFGYLGIIGGMLFVGFYLRVLHEWLFGSRPTIPALFIGITAIYSAFPHVGGTLLSLVNFAPLYATPVLIAHVLVHSLLPAPASASGRERATEVAATAP